jgi:23S rRNA pseudouridine2605 synthase
MKNKANLPGGAGKGQRVQLHRALSKQGWGSRTQAREWIRAGQVCVDGRVVTDPLIWVDLAHQQITRHGEAPPPRGSCTLILHKPRGVVTTRSDEWGRKTVYDLLPAGLPWLIPVGRLDADSEGLLVLTTDATLAVQLTEPAHRVPKTYRVTITGQPTEEALAALRTGLLLADGPTRPTEVCLVRGGQRSILEVVLTEGRNRQVRRMLAAVGHRVRRLVRVAIGELPLGDLEPGQCRLLTEKEIKDLRGSGRRD